MDIKDIKVGDKLVLMNSLLKIDDDETVDLHKHLTKFPPVVKVLDVDTEIDVTGLDILVKFVELPSSAAQAWVNSKDLRKLTDEDSFTLPEEMTIGEFIAKAELKRKKIIAENKEWFKTTFNKDVEDFVFLHLGFDIIKFDKEVTKSPLQISFVEHCDKVYDVETTNRLITICDLNIETVRESLKLIERQNK